MDLPVSIADFTAAGFDVWESPLLSATLSFQSNFVAFTLTMLRYQSLMKLTLEHGLSDQELEHYLQLFGHEISMIRHGVIRSQEDLLNLLRNFGTGSGAHAQIVENWLARLEMLCRAPLFITASNETLAITVESFSDWVGTLEKNLADAIELFRCIADVSVAEVIQQS
jgi:hypothetical protein